MGASTGWRKGSASLVVLGVLAGCLAMLGGTQALLARRATALRVHSNQAALRSAGILGLREGVRLLAEEDDQSTFDDPREGWGAPGRFRSTEGVDVVVRVMDAQDRFDLNRLTLPVTPGEVRTSEDMFVDLVGAIEVEDGRILAREMARELQALGEDLRDPRQILAVRPEWMHLLPVLAPNVCTLPRAAASQRTINLNTVQPEVLTAIVGAQLRSWVDTVVTAREAAPIPSVQAAMRGLPPMVQALLPQVVDVRSDWFRVEVRCERDGMVRQLQALVHRPSPENVEVVQCRW